MSVRNMVCIYYKFVWSSRFLRYRRTCKLARVANVKATVLSDQRAEGKKGLWERTTHMYAGEKRGETAENEEKKIRRAG